MPLLAKRIYDPVDPADGYRILVMRLWPRGIPRSHVDAWERDLAPSVELLRSFRRDEISWDDFASAYRMEIAERRGAQEQVARLRDLAGGQRVTLLCGCQDEAKCHRTLLLEIARPG